MATLPPPKKVRVDVWELRCRFNQAKYYARSAAGEFTIEVKNKPISPERQAAAKLPYAFSQEWWYLDKETGLQVAHGHRYLYEDMSPGTEPDPKDMFLNGLRYHIYRNSDGQTKDRSLTLPEPWSTLYKQWRRLKCFFVGR